MPLIAMGLAGGVTVLQNEQHINQGERLWPTSPQPASFPYILPDRHSSR